MVAIESTNLINGEFDTTGTSELSLLQKTVTRRGFLRLTGAAGAGLLIDNRQNFQDDPTSIGLFGGVAVAGLAKLLGSSTNNSLISGAVVGTLLFFSATNQRNRVK
ncbi:MAG TPA: twin-arginine translocation signal domain-containing protein [Patescibacteria group bacterium]|nr:twin-arginine translocation signal domain-containing protein [Patescibacteria group bacterium]